MSSADGWDLLFRRADLTTSEVRPSTHEPLRPGEVRLAVERFGVTTVTATYARFGDSPMQFLNAFPAPEGLGRVPVWGFATVAESRVPEIAEGSRFFGYLPMSTHHTVTPTPVPGGFFDATPLRDFLHPWYRTYEIAEPDPLDDRKALVHPLYPASYNLAEFLSGQVAAGVRSTLVTSASSKTAIGLAHLLAHRDGIAAIGVTAEEHRAFVTGLGLYDTVLTYDELATAPVVDGTVFVDFTNSVELMETVYGNFASRLAATVLVGFTHPRTSFEPPQLGEPAPELFFTPAVEQQLMAEQGEENYKRAFHAAEREFLRSTESWLTVTHGSGPEAIAAAFRAVLAGKQPPDVADVLVP